MAVTPGQFLKCRHENSTKETNMTTQFKIKRASQTVFTILIAVCCGAILTPAHAQKSEPMKSKSQYQVSSLPTLGGTSNAGNSINNQSWVAGYSRLTGNQSRHAALWRNGSLSDLGTLGGPNSSVTWNVKNTQGIIVGISQTADPEPLGEAWSSAAFYTGPFTVGFINLGFVWEQQPNEGTSPIFQVEITVLPLEPTTCVKRWDGLRMAFMTGLVSHLRYSGFSRQSGLWDRQIRFRTYPCSQATHQELPRRSMIMVKLWAFRASATKPLEDTRPSTPCFGKTAA